MFHILCQYLLFSLSFPCVVILKSLHSCFMQLFTRLKIGSEQFPALTGIRAVAAFMVFFHHLQFWVRPGVLIGLQLSFHFAVCLFFVLSGFLIAYKYSDSVELSASWFKQYFTRRFARIYPVYFLILTIVVLISKTTDPIFLFQNYTLLHSLDPLIPSHGMAIAPSWSLTVEECFYVSAPFIFLLARRYSLLLSFVLFTLLSMSFVLLNGNSLDITGQFVFLFSTIFGRFPEFFAGILLASLVKRRQRGNLPVKGVKFTALGVLLISVLTFSLVYVTNKPQDVARPVMLLVNNLLLPVAISIFYYGLIFELSFIRKVLAHKIPGLFGRSSYAFYLLHLPVITYLGGVYFQQHLFHGHHNVYVVGIFVVCLVLSILVYVFYEEPLRKIITRRALSRTTANSSSPTENWEI